MPEDLKLSQIGSSQLPPPFRWLHSPGVRKHRQIIFACYFRKSSINTIKIQLNPSPAILPQFRAQTKKKMTKTFAPTQTDLRHSGWGLTILPVLGHPRGQPIRPWRPVTGGRLRFKLLLVLVLLLLLDLGPALVAGHAPILLTPPPGAGLGTVEGILPRLKGVGVQGGLCETVVARLVVGLGRTFAVGRTLCGDRKGRSQLWRTLSPRWYMLFISCDT